MSRPGSAGPGVVNRVVLGLLGHCWFGTDRSMVGLAVTGRRSGRVYRLPVQYAEDGDALLLVPARAGSKTWWRNLHGPTAVRVLHHGRWQAATGEVVAPDDGRHLRLAEAYAHRWPRVGVTADPVVRVVLDRVPTAGPTAAAP